MAFKDVYTHGQARGTLPFGLLEILLGAEYDKNEVAKDSPFCFMDVNEEKIKEKAFIYNSELVLIYLKKIFLLKNSKNK